MNRLAALAVLAACGDNVPATPNTATRDAREPRVGCPAIGTRPQFARDAYDVIAWSCDRYTESRAANVAIVSCGLTEHRQGTIGGTFVATTIPPAAPFTSTNVIALFPEGDRMLVRQTTGGLQAALSVYVPSGSSWAWSYDVPVTVGHRYKNGNVSAGPRRRMFISEDTGPSGSQDLVEYEGDGTTWTLVPNGRYHPLGELGFAMYGAVYLSRDGLRMTYSAGGVVAYSDRPNLDARFRRAELIDEVRSGSAYLADDCSSMYFSGLGAVLRADQN